MNARMNFEETANEIKARKLREAKFQKDQEAFEASEKTGFLTVGKGRAVHAERLISGSVYTECGAEGVGSGQVRFAISQLKVAKGPVTCKRCLKIISQQVEVQEDVTDEDPYAIVTMKIDFSKGQKHTG